jgi:hypothetical protein
MRPGRWIYRRGRRVVRRQGKRAMRRYVYALGTASLVSGGACQAIPSTQHVHLPSLPSFSLPTLPSRMPAPSTVGDVDLAALQIDDHPNAAGYKREFFQPNGWEDPDGNGCDARKDTLRRDAAPPLTGPGCSTAGATWPKVYVAGTTTDPRQIDIDHVVPLSMAWRSGARGWEAARRLAIANDPRNLWAVDASANRQKSDDGPEAWRPAEHGIWCTYARRWSSIKITYGLTATTPERDALGQMLETC